MHQVKQSRPSNAFSFPDPLAEDACDDDRIVLTRRRLIRVALVAAETAARFQRDGIARDPMAWMLAPRRAFAGKSPLDACVDLDDCTRAIVIHGLGLPLDPTIEEIDALLADDEGGPDAATEFHDAAPLPSRLASVAPSYAL